MNIELILNTINSLNTKIQSLQIELNQILPQVPVMDDYGDTSFDKFLIEQDILPNNSNYSIYKAQLIEKYQKRQNFKNTIEENQTLINILYGMLSFYQSYLRDPTEDELDDLSVGMGTKENINKAILYIEDNIL